MNNLSIEMPRIANQQIADALTRVRHIANQNGIEILQSNDITRSDREVLMMTGWLQEIIKGWYMLVRPDVAPGDSSAWYSNYWDFLACYLNKRFGEDYCLSAENSLDLLTENPLIPPQIIAIVARGGGGTPLNLPYDTSVLMYSSPKSLPEKKTQRQNLQIMPLALALCRVTPIFFHKQPQQAEIALRMLKSVSELTDCIVRYDHKTAANRLIGAYEFIGQNNLAQQLKENLHNLGIKTRPKNPFTSKIPFTNYTRSLSPYTYRIQSLWAMASQQISPLMPKIPRKPKAIKSLIKKIDHIYQHDAYHSLSIEGYRVTQALIEKVKNNNWSPETDLADADTRNALAARGYYEAFEKVKLSIEKAIKNQLIGEVIEQDLQNWYRALFSPSVTAGIIEPEFLYGYRNSQVYIRGSRHVPLKMEALADAMLTLFECIKVEPHPLVNAILSHYIFVYIHPYMDGNGRMARFLMNSLLTTGGFNWTVIDVKHRSKYRHALQLADEQQNFKPFAKFIIASMQDSLQYT